MSLRELPLARWYRKGLTLAESIRPHCHNAGALLLAVWFTGRDNTCFIFASNPPTGTINIEAGDPQPTCMPTTANGIVRVLTHAVSTCSSCSASSRIAHIFVSVRGIEVHPSAIADDAAPGWQELNAVNRYNLIWWAWAMLPLGEGATIPADAHGSALKKPSWSIAY
jgi:hypothetical protein